MTLARLRTVLRHLRDRPADGPGSDADLARRYAATRDPDAFAELVHRHGRLVWGVCRRATRSNTDADDAYQATWLVFAKTPAAVRTPAAIGGWLHGVAVRVARRVTAKRPAADPTHLPDRAAGVGEAAGVREYLAALDDELARLPDRLRLPLVLCFLEQQTQDEAAKRLGLSLSTLKRRLDAGKELLRSRLAGRGVDLSAALAGAGLTAAGPPTLAGVAGGVAAQVSREVLFAMWTTKLQTWAAGVLVAGGLAAGGGAYVATSYAQGPGKGDGPPVAKSDDKPGGQPVTPSEPRFSQQFDKASWDAALNWFARASGLARVGTVKPTSTVTLAIKDNSLPEVIDLLNEALAVEKFVLLRNERVFRLHPADEKLPADLIPLVTADVFGDRGQTEIVSVVMPVYPRPGSETMKAILALLSPFGYLSETSEARLIVTDRVSVIRKVLAFLQPARAPSPPPADPADVRDLRLKQLETARQAIALLDEQLKAGAVGREESMTVLRTVLGWAKRVYELERDLARTPAERLAAANSYLQRARAGEQVAAARVQRGTLNTTAGLEFTFLRQEAEVFVKQAEQASNRLEKKSASAPERFRGTVRSIQQDGRQFTVRLVPGSDAGLQMGAVLAVHRVSGSATRYVGRVRIETVGPKEAVGVFIPPTGIRLGPDDYPKPGDHLTHTE